MVAGGGAGEDDILQLATGSRRGELAEIETFCFESQTLCQQPADGVGCPQSLEGVEAEALRLVFQPQGVEVQVRCKGHKLVQRSRLISGERTVEAAGAGSRRLIEIARGCPVSVALPGPRIGLNQDVLHGLHQVAGVPVFRSLQ